MVRCRPHYLFGWMVGCLALGGCASSDSPAPTAMGSASAEVRHATSPPAPAEQAAYSLEGPRGLPAPGARAASKVPPLSHQHAGPAVSPSQPAEQRQKASGAQDALTATPVADRRAPAPAQSPIGRITGYVTTTISLLDASGRVTGKVGREQIPLPADGLPFYSGPNNQLILVHVGGRELLLDSGEFKVEMATKLIEETCRELGSRGVAPKRGSPASMGHGECR